MEAFSGIKANNVSASALFSTEGVNFISVLCTFTELVNLIFVGLLFCFNSFKVKCSIKFELLNIELVFW